MLICHGKYCGNWQNHYMGDVVIWRLFNWRPATILDFLNKKISNVLQCQRLRMRHSAKLLQRLPRFLERPMLHLGCKLVFTSNTYILTKVSKLMCEMTELTNLSRRLAIWQLGSTRLNCSLHCSTTCILLVLKSFIKNRFATKSREFNWDLFRFSTSKPYSKIGIHLYFIRCIITSSEAIRPTLPKMLFAAL